MAGAQAVITAPTLEELEARVNEWYEDAAVKGLEDARLPWEPDAVRESDEGYAFDVWAHS